MNEFTERLTQALEALAERDKQIVETLKRLEDALTLKVNGQDESPLKCGVELAQADVKACEASDVVNEAKPEVASESTAVETAPVEEKPKRRRGRPSKAELEARKAAAEVTEPEQTEEVKPEVAATEEKPKRRREVAATEEKPKRRRGRPSKAELEARKAAAEGTEPEVADVETAPVEEKPKRRRGRPSKAELEARKAAEEATPVEPVISEEKPKSTVTPAAKIENDDPFDDDDFFASTDDDAEAFSL